MVGWEMVGWHSRMEPKSYSYHTVPNMFSLGCVGDGTGWYGMVCRSKLGISLGCNGHRMVWYGMRIANLDKVEMHRGKVGIGRDGFFNFCGLSFFFHGFYGN